MELQHFSLDTFFNKYALIDKFGNKIELTPSDTFKRVAKTLSNLEPINKEYWFEEFLWVLENGAIPAGRILANAGAEEYKPNTSVINCLVSDDITDSMEKILDVLSDTGKSLRRGSGLGMCMSLLRPAGSFVSGVGAESSGPLSFADIFNELCKTISSAGGRRGAMMLTFHVFHPDVFNVIKAKREAGRLRQYNISILSTNEFMNAVENDDNWELYFPITKKEYEIALDENKLKYKYKEWPVFDENYLLNNEKNKVLVKIYETVKAKELYDAIMNSTFEFSEPGIINIDTVNELNNLYWCENIIASNPCSEQFLPKNGACLLGSINLTQLVIDPFLDSVRFDWDKYKEIIKIFTRLLDNVVEINGLPLEKQIKEIKEKRRHGTGLFGLGSMLVMMKIKYGSKESLDMIDKLYKELAVVSYETGVELAKEKGPCHILIDKDSRYKFINSKYMQQLPNNILDDILEYGCRFTHATTSAPTGTTAFSIGNNCSNGIEPSFLHHYKRNIIKSGKKTKEQGDVFSYEFLKYKELIGNEISVDKLPDYFSTSNNLSPKEHIDVQAAAQKWIDSSISKCIAKGTNLLTNIGIVPIERIGYAVDPGKFGKVDPRINKVLCPDNKWRKIKNHYYDGFKDTLILKFENGFELEGSHVHKLKTKDGWKKLKDLKVGDSVLNRKGIKLNSEGKNKLPLVLDNCFNFEAMTPKLAEFIGMYLAFGEIIDGNLIFKISCLDKQNRLFDLINKLFNIIIDNNLSGEIIINDKSIIRLLTICGEDKLIPEQLMEGNESELLSLLTGISINTNEGFDIFYSSSKKLINQLFSVGTYLGYSSNIESFKFGNTYYYLLSIDMNTVNKNETSLLRIIEIKNSKNELYDIEVEETHDYVINGIYSHNTINCPSDISFEDFKDLYMYAWKKGCKGITTYRYNPEKVGSVLVDPNLQKNTKVKFKLESNKEIVVDGNETVVYENEEHIAQNLFEAIREGQYGKF